MVWVGIFAIGRTLLVSVPGRINQFQNLPRLKLDPVAKNLSHKVFSGKASPFQEDGAPAHTFSSTQGWLRENIPDFIVSLNRFGLVDGTYVLKTF